MDYKNIIAYSLYGSKAQYCMGALLNAKLVPEVYGDDWRAAFYVDNTVPGPVVLELVKLGALVIDVSREIDWKDNWRMCWRFLAADPDEVQGGGYYLSRDCDSRPSLREKWCVANWIENGGLCCSIRDSESHLCCEIMGGMHGLKRSFSGMRKKVDDFIKLFDPNTLSFGRDQHFLQSIIYPSVKESIVYYGRTGIEIPVPIDRYHIGAYYGPSDEEIEKYGWGKLKEGLE